MFIGHFSEFLIWNCDAVKFSMEKKNCDDSVRIRFTSVYEHRKNSVFNIMNLVLSFWKKLK